MIVLDKRTLLATGVGAALAAALPGAALARDGEGRLPSDISFELSAALNDFPYTQQASGYRVWVIAWKDCVHCQRLLRDHPTPPAGLDMRYVVVPAKTRSVVALMRNYAERTPRSYASFMRGDWDGLGNTGGARDRAEYTSVVAKWRRIDRLLSRAGLKGVTPLFLYGSPASLRYFSGYNADIIARLQRGARRQ